MNTFNLDTLVNKLGTQVNAEVKVHQNFKTMSLAFNANDCQEHYLIFKDKITHIYWDNMQLIEDEFVISVSDFDFLFTSVLKTLES